MIIKNYNFINDIITYNINIKKKNNDKNHFFYIL